MTWILVTARIDENKTRQMRVNFDNIVAYGPVTGAPCALMGTDQQVYPVLETSEQIDEVLARTRDGNGAWVPLPPFPPPPPPQVKLATGKTVTAKRRK